MLKNNKRHMIAVVDDEEHILDALHNLLSDWFDISTFSSSSALLSSLDSMRPSLFIIDWLMPGMDGISLCREIRSHHCFDLVPVVFYTDIDPSLEIMKNAFRAGRQSFISKKASPSFMVAQIRTLIDNYDHFNQYLRHQKMMLSVLKHDMSNLLTGVTTGIHVLFMDSVFRTGKLKRESELIINASHNLQSLFNDLNEVLVTAGDDDKRPVRRELCTEIFSDLRSYLKNIIRKVYFSFPETLTVGCDRHELGRALYYLIRFIDKHVPVNMTVTVSASIRSAGVSFMLLIEGCHKECLVQAISHIDNLETSDAHYELLSVQYFRNFLHRNGIILNINEDDGQTELSFVLPQKYHSDCSV